MRSLLATAALLSTVACAPINSAATAYGNAVDAYETNVLIPMQGSVHPSGIGGGSDAQVRDVYRQERNRDLILQHGYGGCTPNFSTGGCL